MEKCIFLGGRGEYFFYPDTVPLMVIKAAAPRSLSWKAAQAATVPVLVVRYGNSSLPSVSLPALTPDNKHLLKF